MKEVNILTDSFLHHRTQPGGITMFYIAWLTLATGLDHLKNLNHTSQTHKILCIPPPLLRASAQIVAFVADLYVTIKH